MLMYFDFDSANMEKLDVEDFKDLFDAKEDVKTEAYLTKVHEKLIFFQERSYNKRY